MLLKARDFAILVLARNAQEWCYDSRSLPACSNTGRTIDLNPLGLSRSDSVNDYQRGQTKLDQWRQEGDGTRSRLSGTRSKLGIFRDPTAQRRALEVNSHWAFSYAVAPGRSDESAQLLWASVSKGSLRNTPMDGRVTAVSRRPLQIVSPQSPIDRASLGPSH